MTDREVERRRTPRVSVPAHHLVVAQQVRVRVVDISAGGALVETPVLPPPRASLRIALGTGHLEAVVETRHRTQPARDDNRREFRAGATFSGMSGLSRAALERFLGKALTHD